MTFDSSFGVQWMSELIRVNPSEGPGVLVDCFRQFHPTRNDAFTCWATVTSARETNYGRRLDYILASPDFFLKHIVAGDILPDIQGSDHCPVVIDINVSFCPPEKPPSLCTQYLPEFSGRQQKLTSFLTSAAKFQTSAVTTVGTSSQNDSYPRKRKDSVDMGGTKRNKQENQAKLSRFLLKSVDDNKTVKTASDREATSTELQHSSESDSGMANVDTDSVKPVASGNRISQAKQWKSLFKGPAPPPLCKVHKEPCVLRTVKKVGPNQHRQFYVCARPQGLANDLKARCDHFEWASGVKLKSS